MKYTTTEVGASRPLCVCGCGSLMCKKTIRHGKQGWECPEKKRKSTRQARRTPGTYLYNAVHGLGLPGANKNLRQRKLRRRVADAKDGLLIQELEKRLEELDERAQNAEVRDGSDPGRQARRSTHVVSLAVTAVRAKGAELS